MQKIINEFQGEYRFLSNFWPCKLKYDGRIYPHSESAYQAAKCLNESDKKQFIDMEPSDAKRIGRKIKKDPNFENKKVKIMYEIVLAKFTQNEYLAKQLLETDDAFLIEGNNWG